MLPAKGYLHHASTSPLGDISPECGRLVFRIRAEDADAVLSASDDDLEALIGAVAAEANHEPNPRRQRRLDAAFDALNEAALAGR